MTAACLQRRLIGRKVKVVKAHTCTPCIIIIDLNISRLMAHLLTVDCSCSMPSIVTVTAVIVDISFTLSITSL